MIRIGTDRGPAWRFLAATAVLSGTALAVLCLVVLSLNGIAADALPALGLAVGGGVCGIAAPVVAWLAVIRPVLGRLEDGKARKADFPALARRLAAAERDREMLAGLSDAYNRLIIDAEDAERNRHEAQARLFRDIEAQRAELVAARDAAESEALSRSRFFAGMTHELRTPLTAIMGFSEAIEKQIFGPDRLDKYSEYARDIRVGGEHLLETINHLLDLAKAEAGKFELQEAEIDMGGAVEDCVTLLRQMAENRDIKLAHVRDITLPPYLADGQIIKQVVINLLSNAIKFTPAGGSVTVQAGVDATDDLFIAVRDTGAGIPPEEMKRIFEPFHQGAGSRDRRGTGLGLSLSRVFVQLHGGELRLESHEGHGTTAIIHLPAWRWRRGTVGAAASGGGSGARHGDAPKTGESSGDADAREAEDEAPGPQITRSLAAQSK